MPGKILVCYATRYGSTAGIAQAVGEELARSGFLVDIFPAMNVGDIEKYDAVVIGSPLYMGKWLVEARDFIHRFRHPLDQRYVAVFTAGYTLKDRTGVHIRSADDALDVVRLYIDPSRSGFFAGVVDPDGMSAPDRAIVHMGGVTPGDYRDWDAIREWAGSLGDDLQSMGFPAK